MVEVNVQFDVAAQGGFSGFQQTGMVEGFFGFVIFDSGIFLGRNIWQVFFWGWLDSRRDFLWYSKQSDINLPTA